MVNTTLRPKFSATSLLAVADGLTEIPDSFLAACLDGREDTAPAGYSFSSRSDRPADLNNVRADVRISGGHFMWSGIAMAHGSRRDMAGRRAVPCAPLVPPMAYDPFCCSACNASPLRISVPARSSTLMTEPGVFGVFRQVLVLPEGIADTLTPGQLDAILTHELRHIRHRDNLTAALQMCLRRCSGSIRWSGGSGRN